MANLYTKTGDKGTTALVGGSRVAKSDLKVECYGTVDEAISALGFARTQTSSEFVGEMIHKVETRLFAVGAELAADEKGLKKLMGLKPTGSEDELSFVPVTEKDIAYLEGVVDKITSLVGKQHEFVVPGVNASSGALHVARTIVRKAERRVVELSSTEEVRPVVQKYLNRLSDLVFALARYEEEMPAREELCDRVIAAVKETLGMSDSNKQFNLETLQGMALRAQEKARELGVPCVFAAVDDGGNLVLFQRMEGSLLISMDVAQGKAFTAMSMKMPTDEVGKLCQPGQPFYGLENSKPGKFVLFGGGFPFVVDGKVVGGIGVSGGTAEQDMEIARYAMA
ncbi:cob(I)yrinic acid a,c-diamide adenosyltransferase [Paratractidigestivibacter sp.]|uniref:cob(I)yrinic acid a,c-diamide adenosyltransferase n=1 Tax=Paratractidigestivibacter sp. TaxID=2847316 RepID=UPI002ABD9E68|nr:cob(I)yrinic acid a,c-diamide adenosyltransferase [Paratractidigestivibacter sp.]